MNREKIYMTSSIIVLILGEKGRDLQRGKGAGS